MLRAVFVVFLFGGYKIAFLWGADEPERQVDAVLARFVECGVEAECEFLEAGCNSSTSLNSNL